MDSQRDAERKLLFDSFGQGMQAQQGQINNASALMQLDPQLRGLFQNLGSGALGQSLDINNQGLNRFNAFAAARGGNSNTTSSGGPSALNQVGNGLVNSGVGALTNSIGGLFSPSPTTYAQQDLGSF
jgi:hypothetical protein